ncbi:MAG: DUF169 domain-containing protein [candidate division KSB1 bacterium]|nr:DUF169 domain-containing protein [candidate division KSB1 bacterium]MDZ7294899.1 DUF169 domain-containing protein [candidate division KSB1 bacterium]
MRQRNQPLMMPDPSRLQDAARLRTPLIGVYEAPDPALFAPCVRPTPGTRTCIFAFYENWKQGQFLHLTAEQYGCGGAGRWLFGLATRPRAEFVDFLVREEGLRATAELMEQWLDASRPFQPEYGNLFIGPLRAEAYQCLKTVSFVVNPDQLSLLIIGASYHAAPEDPPPVIAPFGSGCGQLLALFPDLSRPQAIVGATDIAMRQHLPPEALFFTVTKPMFERLCALDERSFLFKPFWQRLLKARGC